MRDFDFVGGASPCTVRSSGTSTEAHFQGCTFKHGISGSGLEYLGGGTCYVDGCVAAKNLSDGFNYHSYVNPPRAVEINCTAYKNGLNGGVSNNATTIHDGGSIIRLNGNYPSSEGRTVHDIGATKIWMLNCAVGPSDNGAEPEFKLSDSGTEAWLHGCTITGEALIETGATLNHFDTTWTSISGAGTIQPYTP